MGGSIHLRRTGKGIEGAERLHGYPRVLTLHANCGSSDDGSFYYLFFCKFYWIAVPIARIHALRCSNLWNNANAEVSG